MQCEPSYSYGVAVLTSSNSNSRHGVIDDRFDRFTMTVVVGSITLEQDNRGSIPYDPLVTLEGALVLTIALLLQPVLRSAHTSKDTSHF